MNAPRLNVLITGSAGVIGTVLTRGLPHDIREYELPEQDARDQDALFRASAGVDAIVHLAWNAPGENFRNGRVCSENLQMTLAVLNAARAHGVGRVVPQARCMRTRSGRRVGASLILIASPSRIAHTARQRYGSRHTDATSPQPPRSKSSRSGSAASTRETSRPTTRRSSRCGCLTTTA